MMFQLFKSSQLWGVMRPKEFRARQREVDGGRSSSWWLSLPLEPGASPRPAGSQLDASWEEMGGSTGQDTVRDVYPKSALTFLQTGKAWVLRSLAFPQLLVLLVRVPSWGQTRETLGVTSPPAHPLPPGCHGPGSEHSPARAITPPTRDAQIRGDGSLQGPLSPGVGTAPGDVATS